jgi:hypothetical protein
MSAVNHVLPLVVLGAFTVAWVFRVRQLRHQGNTETLRMVFWPVVAALPVMWFLAMHNFYHR